MKIIKKLLSITLAIVLVIGAAVVPVSAEPTKTQTSRAIGIVFDNSGSMYFDNNTAWCRATYAMEVFASMMNTNDTLYIYPMNEIAIGDTHYNWSDPLIIHGGDETSQIEDIVTVSAMDTPIETVEYAYEGLDQATADEKWLIILTDGASFYKNNQELDANQSTTELDQILKNRSGSDIQTMYLGIGENPVMPTTSIASSEKASDSEEILTKLTKMCNDIFGRDQLDMGDNNSLSFDVPMSKLIVFIQGENIGNVRLKDSSGNEYPSSGMVYNPHYSNSVGAAEVPVNGGSYIPGQNGFTIAKDENLSGCITTFSDLSEGTYQVYFDGSPSSIVAYYEPNVDVVASLYDADGNQVTEENAGDLTPGDYTIKYGLATPDGKMTDSELLGDRSFVIDYSVNGEAKQETGSANGEYTVHLDSGNILSMDKINVDYLSGYHITKTGEEMGWPTDGISIHGLDVEISLDTYLTKLNLKKVPAVVHVSLDGQPLTEEQMENTDLQAVCEDLGCTVTPVPEDSAFEIYFQPDKGSGIGQHELTAQAIQTDIGADGEDTLTFRVHLLPLWLWILLILIVLAILALLFWIYMNQKVLPKQITVDMESLEFSIGKDKIPGVARASYTGDSDFKRKLTLKSPNLETESNATCSIVMDLVAISPRRVPSKDREAKVTKITFTPNTGKNDSLEIEASEFRYLDGKLVKASESFGDEPADSGTEQGTDTQKGKRKGSQKNKDLPALAILKNGTGVTYSGDFVNNKGKTKKMNLQVHLKFGEGKKGKKYTKNKKKKSKRRR